MSITTFSEPVSSLTGFITPIIYVHESDVVLDGATRVFYIPDAGANVIILAQADGGPTDDVVMILPVVEVPNEYPWSEDNFDENFDGVTGSILNYGIDRTYVLQGGAPTINATIDNGTVVPESVGPNQTVNGSTVGITIPITYGFAQWWCTSYPAINPALELSTWYAITESGEPGPTPPANRHIITETGILRLLTESSNQELITETNT